jgi:hydroxymethylpyrimidine/phosphomethylpyrimidine kinase
VLTIAGSDSSGGAGIQADLKAIEANGARAATAVTAVTAQGTMGIAGVWTLPAAAVERQIEVVLDDLDVAAIKSGMLGDGSVLRAVAALLGRRRPRCYVLDPVLVATSGWRLLPEPCVELLRSELLPLATIVTPNVEEAEVLSGIEIRDVGGAERAGRRLLELGAGAVLVKGGHLAAAPATDVLVTPRGVERFAGEPVLTRHLHGTGCVLSAALAAHLARGRALGEAVRAAKAFVTEAIRHGWAPGRGPGPAEPLFALHALEEAKP